MKYSLLMSVYKGDNPVFLRLALRSIYEEQTRKPDEIVVVFDGPLTDELYQVLENFAHDKKDVVRYFPQETNRGLGEALKVGVAYCTGDYIFRMDSDDISDCRRFEKQIKYMESHPEIEVLGTDIAEFRESLDETMRRRVCPAHHENIVKMSKKRSPMNHVTVCIKRTALEKCGGYKTLLYLEDYYLWLRMMVAGCKFANINETLVYARIGNEFINKRSSKIRIKGWRTLQDYMLEHGLITPKEAAANMVYIRVFTYCPNWFKRVIYKVLRK